MWMSAGEYMGGPVAGLTATGEGQTFSEGKRSAPPLWWDDGDWPPWEASEEIRAGSAGPQSIDFGLRKSLGGLFIGLFELLRSRIVALTRTD